MFYRILGRTALRVSAVGLGAGPVPAVMVGGDGEAQAAVVARAVERGVNWIDTAAGYGDGRSEAAVGGALRRLGAARSVHVATKVRLTPDDLNDATTAVRRSLEGSLSRLGLSRVTLLQLHNGVTARRGEIAASLTPNDVAAVAVALRRMRDEGLTDFVGLTGTGSPEALAEAVDGGAFDTVQIPHHLLSPADGRVLEACRRHGVGVFAIRVFAAGALLGRPPSAHTLKTPYFPLSLYEDDRRRAEALGGDVMAQALRFALADDVPHVALVGMATAQEVDEVVALAHHRGRRGEPRA